MSDTINTSRASEYQSQTSTDAASEADDGRRTVTMTAERYRRLLDQASKADQVTDYLERLERSTELIGLDVGAVKKTIDDELDEQWKEGERSWYSRLTIKNVLMSLLAATAVIGIGHQLHDVKNTVKSLANASHGQGGQTELWLTDMSDPTKGWIADVECDEEGKCSFSLPELLKRGAIRISSRTEEAHSKAASSVISTAEEMEMAREARARPMYEREAYERAQRTFGDDWNATRVTQF